MTPRVTICGSLAVCSGGPLRSSWWFQVGQCRDSDSDWRQPHTGNLPATASTRVLGSHGSRSDVKFLSCLGSGSFWEFGSRHPENRERVPECWVSLHANAWKFRDVCCPTAKGGKEGAEGRGVLLFVGLYWKVKRFLYQDVE